MENNLKIRGGVNTPNTIESKCLPRIDSLAGLKVLAMIAIFWWHSVLPNFGVDLGARACEFFFVVSGFLVLYNHYNNPMPANFKTALYYVSDKLCKMWPLHFLCFVAVYILNVRSFSIETLINSIINLLCIQAWSSNLKVAMSFNGVSWFLSAILFCYFVTPFLLKLFKNKKSVCVSLIVGLLLRIILEFLSRNVEFPFYKIQIHTNPVVRCLEFFLGMVTAYLFIKRKAVKNKIVCTIAEIITTLGLIAIVLIFVSYDIKAYRALYVILFCVIVYVFAGNTGLLSKVLSIKQIRWLSNIQFEFYLLHSVVLKYVATILEMIGVSLTVPLVILVVVISEFVLAILISIIYKKLIYKKTTLIMKKFFRGILKDR